MCYIPISITINVTLNAVKYAEKMEYIIFLKPRVGRHSWYHMYKTVRYFFDILIICNVDGYSMPLRESGVNCMVFVVFREQCGFKCFSLWDFKNIYVYIF